MDNEILKDILSELKDLKTGQAKLEVGQAKLEAGQAKLETEITDVKAELAGVKELAQITHESILLIENVWFPKITAALEGHSFNSEKLKDHEERIDGAENMIIRHSMEIELLKTR